MVGWRIALRVEGGVRPGREPQPDRVPGPATRADVPREASRHISIEACIEKILIKLLKTFFFAT